MMTFNFIKQKKEEYHITEEEIVCIEERYNIKFPQILKSYYILHNGDTVKLCRFTIDDYEYSIAKIVQLKSGTATFEHIVDNDREDGIIGENMMPVARNEGGDYFYWDKVSEKVFLFLCDDIENHIYICDNIEDLFKLMNNSCDN